MIAALFVATGGLAERFFAKTSRAPSGCLLWTGSKNRRGYGQIAISSSTPRLAHRVAWLLSNGSWPKQCLLHSCDTPACVEISHLREGTRADNNAEMDAKGRSRRGIAQSSKTHCVRGHEFSGNNLRRDGRRRICRTCKRDSMRARRAAAGVTE